MATEEITISELELADEVLADMTLPVDTATETRAVTLKQLRAWLGSALPIGSVFASVGRLDDERFTLLDGKTISRIGTFEAFCNKVVEKVQAGTWKACTEEEFNLEVSETGQCGKFVVSDDYVRIPKLGNSLYSEIIDGTISVAGTGMTLGLTNGTSNFGWYLNGNYENNKMFTPKVLGKPAGTGYSANSEEVGENKSLGLTTDPTNSGIEGKLETNPIEVFYYMVISTEGQTASVELDVNKVYEDLNLKANSDLSNVASVASSFKEQSVGWSMPDYSAGVTVSTGTFTAPTTGFLIGGSTTTKGSAVIIKKDGVTITEAYTNTNYQSYGGVNVPTIKNEVFEITNTNGTLKFYPCKGVI